MSILLDSSVLIPIERGDLDLVAALDDQKDEEVAMASITASELFPTTKRASVTRVTAPLGTARPTAPSLIVWLRCWPRPALRPRYRPRPRDARCRAARGAVMDAHDLIIAATAVYLDAAVATRDLRGFTRIKGLRILQW